MQMLIMCDPKHYRDIRDTLDLFNPVFLWTETDIHNLRTHRCEPFHIIGTPHMTKWMHSTLNYREKIGDIRIIRHELNSILVSERTPDNRDMTRQEYDEFYRCERKRRRVLAQSNFYSNIRKQTEE